MKKDADPPENRDPIKPQASGTRNKIDNDKKNLVRKYKSKFRAV